MAVSEHDGTHDFDGGIEGLIPRKHNWEASDGMPQAYHAQNFSAA